MDNRQDNRQEVEQRYVKACQDYLRTFCEVYDLQYDKDPWIANDVGGVAMIGDYFINFSDMRFMLRNNVPFDTFLEHHDYCLVASEYRFDMPNLKAWVMGCPRISKEGIKRIADAHKALQDLIEEERKNATL